MSDSEDNLVRASSDIGSSVDAFNPSEVVSDGDQEGGTAQNLSWSLSMRMSVHSDDNRSDDGIDQSGSEKEEPTNVNPDYETSDGDMESEDENSEQTSLDQKESKNDSSGEEDEGEEEKEDVDKEDEDDVETSQIKRESENDSSSEDEGGEEKEDIDEEYEDVVETSQIKRESENDSSSEEDGSIHKSDKESESNDEDVSFHDADDGSDGEEDEQSAVEEALNQLESWTMPDDTFTTNKLKLFETETVQGILREKFESNGLTVKFEIQNSKVTFYISSSGPRRDVEQIIENLLVETTLALDDTSKNVLHSPDWKKELAACQENNYEKVLITPKDDNKIIVTATSDLHKSISNRLKKFIEDNSIYSDIVDVAEESHMKFAQKYWKYDLDDIERDLSSYSVSLSLQEMKIVINGTKFGIKEARCAIEDMLGKILCRKHTETKPGIEEIIRPDTVGTIEDETQTLITFSPPKMVTASRRSPPPIRRSPSPVGLDFDRPNLTTSRAPPQFKGDPVEIVRWNYIHLKEGMCYNTIVDKLISSLCLSDEDKQIIEQTNSNRHKCERLIKCLLRNAEGLNLCRNFLSELRVCPVHCHLYRTLEPIPSTRASRSFHVSGTELRESRKTLVEELEPKIISDKLFAKHVLSDAEHDNIMEEESRSRQAHRLLFILEDKSQEKLDTFLDILDELNLSIEDMLQGHRQAAPQRVHKVVSVIRQSFRYVKEMTCPYCELIMDYLTQNESITDTERRSITEIDRRKELLRCSKLTKFVLLRGKRHCKIFLQAYETPQLDSKFIVDEINSRFETRKNDKDPHIPQAVLPATVLQSHHNYLVEELEAQPLLDALFEESLLEVTDHNKVEDETRRADQIRILLSKIEKLDNQKFSHFVWVMEQNGYDGIIEEIKDSNIAGIQQEDSTLEAVVDDGVIHIQQRGRIPDGQYLLKLSARGGNDVLRQAMEHSVKEAVEHSVGATSGAWAVGAPGPPASTSWHHSTMYSDHTVSGTAIEHSESDINELCLKFSSMMIDDVTDGSVIIHVHPVTDSALQKLLDAEKNGSLKEFMVSLLSRNKLDQEFVGQEVYFDVELVKDPEGGSQRRTELVETRTFSQMISDNMEDFKEEVEPRQMAKLFMKKRTLSENECSDILSSKMSRKERVEKLLTLLIQKMQNEIEKQFIDVLTELGYTRMLDILQVQSEAKHQHAASDESKKNVHGENEVIMTAVLEPIGIED